MWAVDFPDLDGAYTCGEDMEEALYMAKDLLEGWLIIADEAEDPIPKPSSAGELSLAKADVLIPIEVDLEQAKRKHLSAGKQA